MDIKVLSIIIPAYNEEDTIVEILDRVFSVQLIEGIQMEVIVVNDNSQDNTGQIVESYLTKHPDLNMRYEAHEINRGKGAAIRTGFKSASGEYVVVQDADLEYDPNEFNILLSPVIKAGADVVYGSRFMGGRAHRILFFWHSIGNKFLTFLSNAFTDLNLTDMETCYKLIKKDILDGISLVENRFGFEPEITAKLSRIKGIKLYEVGISYYGRTYAEGKKIGWKDGFRAIYCIVKYNTFSKK